MNHQFTLEPVVLLCPVAKPVSPNNFVQVPGCNITAQYLIRWKGCPNPTQGTIDQPLRLHEVEYRMHVGAHPDANPAITHFKTERTNNMRTLLQVQIDTGRQHQIRAHLS